MSNNRITPFVKRMRTTGGTIYTFSSAVEDIGLNINERNNVVKISHFALLNIPKINEPDSIDENRFNVLATPNALEYNTGASIKDGRVLIAESFQNYALNLESNLLNQNSYDSTLSKTVSERVFWKWMKETGAVRWADPSNGYWMEALDADGSLGYNTVVKYFGLVSAGNVRSDSFGTYNETYILVPTSHGQMEAYFEQTEDTNYHHGMQIGDLGENILGRESYTRPHPDGLDFRGYYDYIDSSVKVWNSGPYNMTVDGVPGGWYSAEGINPINENTYLTDTSAYLTTGIYDASIKYFGGPNTIEFLRSKVDCMSLVLDLNKLKTIYNDSNLTFDALATGDYAINDTFEFNAVMIYYSIYNAVQDTILATNLLGILFLDAPSGSTQQLGDGMPGILLPSLEKIQSGVGGFGTSYSLRLNIKSDNITDDTNATYVDAATSDQLYAEDWNQAFYELERAVNILTQNNGVLSHITEQYMGIQNTQTQILNSLSALQYQVNDIGRDILGEEGTIAMFSAGDDPLVESSIYMKNGKIGLFTNNPKFPVQIDASLKTKDIYIEKAIRDASGNILLGYGSPLQIGSLTSDKSLLIYSGNNGISSAMDTSIKFFKPVYFDTSIYQNGVPISAGGNYVPNASLGNSFSWEINPGFLEVDVSGAFDNYATYDYVDQNIDDVSTRIYGIEQEIEDFTTFAYVDGSLSARDSAIGLKLDATHTTTYNHGNFNTAYSHSQTSGNPHSTTYAQLGGTFPTHDNAYHSTAYAANASPVLTGNVGIGANSGSYDLYVFGTGTGTIYATGTIYSNSDIRDKNVFGEVSEVLELFEGIEIIVYNFKKEEDQNKRHFGYSAQNVNQIFPFVSTHTKDDKYEIDHLGMSALNTKAIKELKKENDELKSRLIALEQIILNK